VTDQTLSPLPYAGWEPTKTTLHLWCQVVGKIRLRYTAHRNQWWNVTLVPTARGLSTLRMRHGSTLFDLEFDFIDHALVLRSNQAHAPLSLPLEDGLSVATFYERVMEMLREIDIVATILAKPYGVPMTTPFAEDRAHHHYDRTMVRRWFDAISWTTSVFEDFASEFAGKESPVHVFWHSFDLAMARFSGLPAGGDPRPDRVQQEAYSQQVIAFGFWPGDPNTPAPTYYTYTAPEPASLIAQTLQPEGAAWVPSGSGHAGNLPFDIVRTSADPRAALLAFLRSGYEAGTETAQWNVGRLASSYPGRRTPA
jgi:hypothetical protein